MENSRHLRPAPLVWGASLFALGITAQGAKLPVAIGFFVIVILLMAAVVKKRAAIALFMIFYVAGSYSLSNTQNSWERHHIVSLAKQKRLVSLVGTGTAIQDWGNRGQFDLLVFTVKDTAGNGKRRLPGRGKVRIYYNNPLFPKEGIDEGDSLKITGRLTLPQDEDRFRRLDIHGVLSAQQIEKQESENRYNLFSNTAKQVSKKAKYLIATALPGDKGGLLEGILLGGNQSLSEQTSDKFRDAGLSHITAVSGMNVGFIILISVFLLSRIGLPKTVLAIIIIPFLAFYALLTELQPSVLRATLMGMTLVSGWLFFRRYDVLNSLAVTALILLTWNPNLLYNIGFQLSFMATFGILLFYPLFNREASASQSQFFLWIREAFSLAVSAQIMVTPLLLYHFKQFSVVSLPANIAAFGVVPPLFIIGMSGVAAGLLFPGIGLSVLTLGGWLSAYLLGVAYLFADIPGAVLNIASFSWITCLILYCLILAVYYIWAVLDKAELLLKPALFIALGTGVFFTANIAAEPIFAAPFTAVFMDVGQGDATLLKNRAATILIDTGPQPNKLLRALEKQGISRFDMLVITHSDWDHAGGAPAILRNYTVGSVLIPREPSESMLREEILKLAKQKKIRIITAREGLEWKAGLTSIKVLSPDGKGAEEESVNNASAVLKVSFGKVDFLLLGDLENEGQDELLHIPIQAEILKVAHHGSRDATNSRFLRKVNPELAVISVGKGNSYGHPHRDTLNKLRKTGAAILRTDHQGTVRILADGKRYEIKTEKHLSNDF